MEFQVINHVKFSEQKLRDEGLLAIHQLKDSAFETHEYYANGFSFLKSPGGINFCFYAVNADEHQESLPNKFDQNDTFQISEGSEYFVDIFSSENTIERFLCPRVKAPIKKLGDIGYKKYNDARGVSKGKISMQIACQLLNIDTVKLIRRLDEVAYSRYWHDWLLTEAIVLDPNKPLQSLVDFLSLATWVFLERKRRGYRADGIIGSSS